MLCQTCYEYIFSHVITRDPDLNILVQIQNRVCGVPLRLKAGCLISYHFLLGTCQNGVTSGADFSVVPVYRYVVYGFKLSTTAL